MNIFFNELSLSSPCANRVESFTIMQTFLDTYQILNSLAPNDGLYINEHFNDMEIATGYSINNWRDEPSIDIETKRKLRTILNRSHCYSELKDTMEIYNADLVCDGQKCIGLLLAYISSGITISFSALKKWSQRTITGNYYEINECTYEIQEVEVSVLNAATTEIATSFVTDLIKTNLEKKIYSSNDLWQYRGILFEHLVFCERVEKQLYMENQQFRISQIFDKLLMLEDYFKNYSSGGFQKSSLLNTDMESEATLKKYAEEHTFKTPDGKELLFSWHTRFSTGSRIYFYHDLVRRICYIGHIDGHLPTVKYN